MIRNLKIPKFVHFKTLLAVWPKFASKISILIALRIFRRRTLALLPLHIEPWTQCFESVQVTTVDLEDPPDVRGQTAHARNDRFLFLWLLNWSHWLRAGSIVGKLVVSLAFIQIDSLELSFQQ